MRLSKYIFVLLFLFSSSLISAEEEWQPLYNRVDADLQKQLEERVNSNREWRSLVRNKRIAVCVVDLSDEPTRFARGNDNQLW